MTLELYTYRGKRNVVKKNIVFPTITFDNFVYKDRVGDLNLDVTVTYSTDLQKSNYAIIYGDPVGTNYNYFIEGFEHLTNGLSILHLHMDVLQQYQSYILNMVHNGDMICIRSGSINSADGQPLEDDTVVLGSRSPDNQEVIDFGSFLTWVNPYFLLIVAGSYGVFHSTNPAILSEEVDSNENS